MYRQGDVLIVAVSMIPTNVKPVEPENGRNVLAHGEVTGHAHTLDVAATELMIASDGEMYVRVLEETPLTHQEHDAIVLPPGNYKVTRQREYHPQEIRQVRD